jgi:hypothetical protein
MNGLFLLNMMSTGVMSFEASGFQAMEDVLVVPIQRVSEGFTTLQGNRQECVIMSSSLFLFNSFYPVCGYYGNKMVANRVLTR